MFERIGFGEVALIVIAALVIFGPSKLPQLGKSVGEGIREFKKSMRSVTEDVVSVAVQKETGKPS
jgi:sec-independent protein translocase protein TatA